MQNQKMRNLLTYKGKQYELVPEEDKGKCKGCDLHGNAACSAKVTTYCTKGYILKLFKAKNKCYGG